MMVIGQFDANTLTVSNAVEQALTEFEPLFADQQINLYSHLFRPADYIQSSVSNLSSHLLLGGLFVIPSHVLRWRHCKLLSGLPVD
jgi:multidrug efflux pump subunit AcrB